MSLVSSSISASDFSRASMAETYERIYPWMAKDFIHNVDISEVIRDIAEWMNKTNREIDRMSRVIAGHTHPLPPHTHVTSQGPTSQNTTGLTSLRSTTSSTMTFSSSRPIQNIKNTTGTTYSLQNKIGKGITPIIGAIDPSIDRRLSRVDNQISQKMAYQPLQRIFSVTSND